MLKVVVLLLQQQVVVVLVLLNARQNLRQVKYARALGALMGTRQS